MPTATFVTENLFDKDIQNAVKKFDEHNYITTLEHPDEFNFNEISNILIVDLDNYNGKDCELFKETLSMLATRILIVCTKSLQRLNYYKEFECFSSWENLLTREFFVY